MQACPAAPTSSTGCGSARDAAACAATCSSSARGPLAYMLCPVDDGIVRNVHVGFDPEAAALSPGAVLQWNVLVALLEEGRHRLFDFTPGDGQHKRLFATRSVACADAMLLRPSPLVLAVIAAQRGCDLDSASGAALLGGLGLLAPMRALLRR